MEPSRINSDVESSKSLSAMPLPKFIVGTAINATLLAGIGALMGVVYGAICNANKKVAAQAFAIRLFVGAIIGLTLNYATGGAAGSKAKIFYLLQAASVAIMDTIFILAARRLNLIATTGTIVFGIISALCILGQLEKAHKAQNGPVTPLSNE